MTSYYPYTSYSATTTASSGVYPMYWANNAAGASYSPRVAYQPTGGNISYDDLARERMTDVSARIKRRLERGNG